MPEEEVLSRLSPGDHLLVVTGQRGTRKQRSQIHLVLFGDCPVALSNGVFVLLLELVRARLETHTGYLCLPAQSDPEAFRLGIHRLRTQIDACLGPGAGMKWIETGVGTEYRLTVHPDELGIDPGFSELPWSLAPSDLRDFLVGRCTEVEVPEVRATSVQLH